MQFLRKFQVVACVLERLGLLHLPAAGMPTRPRRPIGAGAQVCNLAYHSASATVYDTIHRANTDDFRGKDREVSHCDLLFWIVKTTKAHLLRRRTSSSGFPRHLVHIVHGPCHMSDFVTRVYLTPNP